jgi:uncharacterized OB-fold protein
MTMLALDADGRVLGKRCARCGHVTVQTCERCPACGGEVAVAAFEPYGKVWAATIVRIPVPGRQPPYGLAYVDLDDGPRVLAHVPGSHEAPLKVGEAVVITSVSPDGDLEVVPR